MGSPLERDSRFETLQLQPLAVRGSHRAFVRLHYVVRRVDYCKRKKFWDNNRELQIFKRTPDWVERERWDMSVRDGDRV